MNQSITLKEDTPHKNNVVYSSHRKLSPKEAYSKSEAMTPLTPFGEKQFLDYCREKAETNVCDGKKVTVRVSFFIDETGKPTDIKFIRSTCDAAKKEVERLLSSSPVWTTKNKTITTTIKW